MAASKTMAGTGTDGLSDFSALMETLPEPDGGAVQAARARQNSLTKPPGSLGALEDITVWLAGWQGREIPRLDTVHALIFAGNHGVVAQGVSSYPASVTRQMVENFHAGGAAICQLCKTYDIHLDVTALALENPTADITQSPAMSLAECRHAIGHGQNAVPENADALVIGEMGIGNTTIAACLSHALLGGSPGDWTGPGTGLDAQGVSHKAAIVAQGVALHGGSGIHPFEVLRRLGGREIAAMAGAILQARIKRIPVFLDGYVCGAAALVLEKAQTGALDHCLAGHVSAEPGHRLLLKAIAKEPLIDIGMRLGEGTGAAIALGIVRGAIAAHAGMATFASAGIDEAE